MVVAGCLILGSFGQLVGRLVSCLVSQPLGSSVVSSFSGRFLVGRLLDQLSGPLVVRLFSGWSWVARENIEIEERRRGTLTMTTTNTDNEAYNNQLDKDEQQRRQTITPTNDAMNDDDEQ